MRITSNFTDQYDYCLPTGHDTDREIVYSRMMEITVDSTPIYKHLLELVNYQTDYRAWIVDDETPKNHKYTKLSAQLVSAFLAINGKTFIFYYYSDDYFYDTYPHNKEELLKPVKINTTFNAYPETVRKYRERDYWQRCDITARYVGETELNAYYDAPIVLVTRVSDDMVRVYKNPSLRSLGFNLMDDIQVYQEISMFLGAKKDGITPLVPDPDKVETKGFDKKISFRKR